jgi:hypothetical protein
MALRCSSAGSGCTPRGRWREGSVRSSVTQQRYRSMTPMAGRWREGSVRSSVTVQGASVIHPAAERHRRVCEVAPAVRGPCAPSRCTLSDRRARAGPSRSGCRAGAHAVSPPPTTRPGARTRSSGKATPASRSRAVSGRPAATSSTLMSLSSFQSDRSPSSSSDRPMPSSSRQRSASPRARGCGCGQPGRRVATGLPALAGRCWAACRCSGPQRARRSSSSARSRSISSCARSLGRADVSLDRMMSSNAATRSRMPATSKSTARSTRRS